MLYSYPKFSKYDFACVRFGGPGLGNLLFPWARCQVVTMQHDLAPIAPTWGQIKLGPFLRNERDKRHYFDLFTTRPEQVSGLKKYVLLSRLSRVSEIRCLDEVAHRGGEGKIIIFQGVKDFFAPILTHHEDVRRALLDITLTQHKKGLEFNFRRSISVHVRLSDFASPKADVDIEHGTPNQRLSITWFIDVIEKLREILGQDIPVYIFSDGTDAELSDLLRLPHCRRLVFGSSVADLLALSSANILVASASTFSMWASYLGRMPVIWHQGRLTQRLYYDRQDAEIEHSLGESLPRCFIELALRNSMG